MLEGNPFDEDNKILCTLFRVDVANCGLSYCKKSETNNNGRAAWKELVEY